MLVAVEGGGGYASGWEVVGMLVAVYYCCSVVQSLARW